MGTCAQLNSVFLALGLCLSGCGWTTQAPKVPEDVLDIIQAVDEGDHAELERLLKGGATPTPAGTPLSPLHAALTHFGDGKLGCDSTALKLLLDHGADANFIDDDSGFAPLEEALSFGDIECARLLKAEGADVNRHGRSGGSTLGFAVKGAVHTNDTSILKLVLSWGVDPNVLDRDYDSTALHEASGTIPGQDAAPVIEELLRSGTDPCIVDSRGATAWDSVNTAERSTARRKQLADAMRACPPTGTGPYYERAASTSLVVLFNMEKTRTLHGVIDKIEFDAVPKPLIWVRATGTSVFGQPAITPDNRYWRVQGGSLMKEPEWRARIIPEAEVSIDGYFGRNLLGGTASRMIAEEMILKDGCRLHISNGSRSAGPSPSACLPPRPPPSPNQQGKVPDVLP